MRAPPEEDDEFGSNASSDDEVRGGPSAPAGAFQGTAVEYGRSTSTPGNSYY